MPPDRTPSQPDTEDADRDPRRGRGPGPLGPWYERPVAVGAVLAFQVLCGLVILADVGLEIHAVGLRAAVNPHLLPELLAILGLGISTPFVASALMRLKARQRQLEKGMSVASGALSGMIEGYFESWGLTPAEQAVATYTIKGYAIAEVAALRGSAEGTIKTHLNAIYRKAGVAGRAQLVSLLIEDLMRAPLVDPRPQRS